MKITEVSELLNYRRVKSSIEDEHHHTLLFGVCDDLSLGVVEIKKISKKYLYSVDDKYCFSRFVNNHYVHERYIDIGLFTTSIEAWKFLNNMLFKRKKFLDDYFEKENSILKIALELIEHKMVENPEYFV